MENILESYLRQELSEEEQKIFSKLPEGALLRLRRVFLRVNSMKKNELIGKVMSFNLDPEGDEKLLRQKLKDSYKKIILASIDLSLCSELLPFYVIIDFEATCEEVVPPEYRHEIIEFPAVLVNTRKQEITDCFQMYCKPQINPKISSFCTELTGITQEQVDSAETFDKVLQYFKDWLAKHNLGKKNPFKIVTDGPWDISRFLVSQCLYSDVKFPKWATEWVNLRRTFSKFYQCERTSLKNMLEFLEMDFIGRPHCGLDDAKNISRILLRMIYDGANIQANERVTISKKSQQKGNDDFENRKIHNWNCNNDGLNIKMKKLRIEAHYTSLLNTSNVPVYKKSKKNRILAETQLAMKILSDPNSENIENKPKRNSNWRKFKKVLRES